MSSMYVTLALATLAAVSSYTCPTGKHVINLNGKLGTAELPSLGELGTVIANMAPSQGIVLKLLRNNITTFPPDVFTDDIFRLVVELDLSSNLLAEIQLDLLDNFSCLERLDVSNNNLVDVLGDMFQNLTLLLHLNLSYNSLKQLPSDLFLTTKFLKSLDLSHNAITNIGSNTFNEDLRRLEYVDLSYNKITAFEPWPYIPRSLYLKFILHHNEISSFTNNMGWTRETSRSYVDSLEVDLRFNKLVYLRKEMFVQYMKNKTATAYDIGNLKLDITNNPWFCDCGVYYAVKISRGSFYEHLAGKYLTCESPVELKGKRLGYFYEHPDLLICNITESCPQGCKCEDRPHQGYIVVNCSTSGEYTSLPVTTPRGNIFLQMSGNKIQRLDEREYIENISVLDVSHNQIVEIDNSFIESASNLTFLDLRHNNMKSLPSKLQRFSFESVEFMGNPLECTCDSLWLNDWVRRNSENISSDLKSHLICSFDGRDLRLDDVTWTSLACYIDIAIGASIALAFLLVFIIVGTVIVCKYKYEFKVWMYHYLQVHPFDKATCDKGDDATKLYDVYLSIDRQNEDVRMWVKNRLLRRLEVKTRRHPAYKVYYPCRQDDFGDCIADQMVENINKSRRVLAIINDSYLRNGWSIEEFDHSHRLMEEARSGRLLVLVYGDLDLSTVTQEPLRTYLTQRNCLHLSDKWVWEKLQYELPNESISNVTSASRESLTSGISSIHATLSECSDLSSFQMDDPDFVITGVV